jgi:hypothetical protein
MSLYAFYTPDPADGGVPPIVRFLEHYGNPATPEYERVTQMLVRPFLEQWLTLALEQGISMEGHGQNLVLSIPKKAFEEIMQGKFRGRLADTSAEGSPFFKFIHRDFGSFVIDTAFRKAAGLPMPEAPTLNGQTPSFNRASYDSILSDSLNLYFKDIMNRLSEAYPTWQAKGWVKAKLPPDTNFRRLMAEDFEKLFEARTGRHFRFVRKRAESGEWDAVLDTREAIYGARGLSSVSSHPRPDCRPIAGL